MAGVAGDSPDRAADGGRDREGRTLGRRVAVVGLQVAALVAPWAVAWSAVVAAVSEVPPAAADAAAWAVFVLSALLAVWCVVGDVYVRWWRQVRALKHRGHLGWARPHPRRIPGLLYARVVAAVLTSLVAAYLIVVAPRYVAIPLLVYLAAYFAGRLAGNEFPAWDVAVPWARVPANLVSHVLFSLAGRKRSQPKATERFLHAAAVGLFTGLLVLCFLSDAAELTVARAARRAAATVGQLWQSDDRQVAQHQVFATAPRTRAQARHVSQSSATTIEGAPAELLADECGSADLRTQFPQLASAAYDEFVDDLQRMWYQLRDTNEVGCAIWLERVANTLIVYFSTPQREGDMLRDAAVLVDLAENAIMFIYPDADGRLAAGSREPTAKTAGQGDPARGIPYMIFRHGQRCAMAVGSSTGIGVVPMDVTASVLEVALAEDAVVEEIADLRGGRLVHFRRADGSTFDVELQWNGADVVVRNSLTHERWPAKKTCRQALLSRYEELAEAVTTDPSTPPPGR